MPKAILREDVEAGRAGLGAMTDPGVPRLPPLTPGEVLAEEFLRPLGLSASALARELGVPANRVTAILHGQRAISADTALRLAARLGTTAEFWMNLQVAHDLEQARAAARAA